MNETEARMAVASGAAALALDQGENWRDRLDAERIDVRSLRDCPLGQLYGDYSYATSKLSGYPEYSRETCRWARDHGFESANVVQEEYDMLTAAWKEYLSV